MAEKDIKAGSDWDSDIREALKAARIVIILLTPRSKERPWIMLEAGAAWALEKRIVPALNQVEASELIEPLGGKQARVVETVTQRRDLAQELAQL
jgi:TIR domain